LIQKVVAWHKTAPCAFWNISGAATLTVHVGEPEPNSLLELWIPNAANDYVCDMTGNVEMHGTLSDNVMNLLKDDGQVAAIVDALALE
jgi:hypothetical protein